MSLTMIQSCARREESPRALSFPEAGVGKLKSLPPRLSRAAPRVGFLPVDHDATRAEAQPWRAWYKTARWQKLRLEVLARDLYVCQATGVALDGRYPAPTSPVVDHKQPHRGDAAFFWDPTNLWSVSKAYHDREKQRQEAAERGRARGATRA
jgi:5-methylcytosine-specific restriction enzyme A